MKPSLCAFNISRQSFISLDVAVADTPLTRLRGLLGKIRMRSDEGLWVVPSHGIHTIGLLFPIDVLYLDSSLRVVGVVEHLRTSRFAPLRWKCASVLELPVRSVYESGTQKGDQLMICTPKELHSYWDVQRAAPSDSPGTGSPAVGSAAP